MYDTEYTIFRVFKKQYSEHVGHFFNSDIDNAGGYGSTLYSVYLKMKNPLVIDCNGQNYSDIRYDNKNMDTYEWAKYAKKNKYDGVIFENISDGVGYSDLSKNTTDYVAFNSNQIKSAEPITYDDDGNIIPLSERFNDEDSDIRFSPREYEDINVDEFDENDYNELKLTSRDVRRFYSEAITWDADKVGQVCKKNLGEYTYVYSVGSEHTLTLLGKYKYTNIHERKEYENVDKNRGNISRRLKDSRSGYGNDRTGNVGSKNSGTANENGRFSRQEVSTERRSDGTGYTESSSNVDLQEENGEIKNQNRDSNSLDNRTLLANALMSTAQNDVERDFLNRYKEYATEINEKQEKLGEYRRQIRELSFAKGKRDTETIAKLRNRAEILETQINRADKRLLKLESTKALKDVLERERKKAYKKAKAESDKVLKEYREKQRGVLLKLPMRLLI